ncbi:MAG: hypothetical protein WEA24_07465 [Gemmatimonadota bacterium]
MTTGERSEAALAGLLRLEAHRARAAELGGADPARLADGWERRCVADGRRAAELMELYAELGFEVVADPVAGMEIGGEDCADCQLVAMLSFRVIYTRRAPDS